jgi:hypothetical protein
MWDTVAKTLNRSTHPSPSAKYIYNEIYFILLSVTAEKTVKNDKFHGIFLCGYCIFYEKYINLPSFY